MLDNETKRRIDTARDILVGKVPDPKSQVEQITIALIYKFMDDMDAEAEELGGNRKFFSGEFEKYGWKKLMAPDLGGYDVLTLYGEAIQKMNVNPNIPQLFRDIFKNAYLPYRDPETLKSFLKTIDDFEYDHSERLGDAFEYLLSVLGSQGDAGQFRTPRHIIDFMVDIIDPKKDNTILDPACGTAGFLISSYKHIVKHNSSNFVPEKDKEAFEQTDVSIAELTSGGTVKYIGDKITPDERALLSKNIKGYDISPDMVRLSLVNLYLHQFPNPQIFEYDTLTSEDNWNEYADVILANPPFMSPKGGIKPHKRFSIPSNRSEVLFVDYMVEHLTPNGKAAIIVPEGIIFQSGNAYKQLRKALVENYLFAVVSLPAGVFQPYSGVKTSILLIDKALNKKTDKILFVKIENDGFDLGAQRRPKPGSQLPTAVKLVKEYISGCNSALDVDSILIDKFGPNSLWNIATKEKISENGDWNLSGGRYKVSIHKATKYELVDLESITDLITCGVAKRPEYVENGIPFLSSKNVKNAKIIWSDYNFITEEMHQFLTKNNKPAKGDILYTRVGSYGEAAVIEQEKEFSIFVSLTLIKPKNNVIDPYYLRNVLNSDHIKKLASENITGIGVGNLNVGAVRKFRIPLPPLEIQKEIVAEIESWQKIIDGARQVVENYKPQIDIDPKWPMVELGEVCKLIGGGTPSKAEKSFWESGTIKWISSKYIDDEGKVTGYDLITEKSIKSSSTNVVPQGSTIAITRVSVGKVAYADDEYAINQDLTGLIVKDNERLNNEFLFYSVKSLGTIIDKNAQGLGVRGVTRDFLAKLEIPIPPLEAQKAIVNNLLKEQETVNSNKQLISIFEQKIKDKIAKVWGE